MMMPAFLYGPWSDVKTKSRAKLRDLKRGVPVEELPAGEWIDTTAASGMLVLEGPWRGLPPGAHFHCFALTKALLEDPTRDRSSNAPWLPLYEAGLKWPWALLGLLGQQNAVFFDPDPARWKPFLRAAVEFWPVLSSEGERYTKGSATPQGLWALHTNIKFVLARIGAGIDELKGPLPAGGIEALASRLLGPDA
jgi:hypothetical protein